MQATGGGRQATGGRLLAAVVIVCAWLHAGAAQERPTGQGFTFRTGVELINVSATVTDQYGRFVPGLKAEDFVLYEDGKPQAIAQFESERVPVSLGIALDTSGSMLGEKIVAAQAALNRFLVDLLGEQDEVFLYRFDSRPMLIQSWTEDRQAVSRALGQVKPNGGTAIHDTIVETIPMAKAGTRRKKALLLISDGNDTSSQTSANDLRHVLRETEVLVYAIAIDASGGENYSAPPPPQRPPADPKPLPVPSPFPGKKPTFQPAPPKPAPPPPPPPRRTKSSVDRVNVDALRGITDDSGGRTEIIISPRDLDPATAGIADELSRQYFIGYSSSLPKDGKWHTIELKLRKGNYTVRARKGFVAN